MNNVTTVTLVNLHSRECREFWSEQIFCELAIDYNWLLEVLSYCSHAIWPKLTWGPWCYALTGLDVCRYESISRDQYLIYLLSRWLVSVKLFSRLWCPGVQLRMSCAIQHSISHKFLILGDGIIISYFLACPFLDTVMMSDIIIKWECEN